MTKKLYIAIAPFCWGRSDKSANAAIRFAKANFSEMYGGKTPQVVLWEAPEGSSVSEMGGITYWPERGAPVELGRYMGWAAALKANPVQTSAKKYVRK